MVTCFKSTNNSLPSTSPRYRQKNYLFTSFLLNSVYSFLLKTSCDPPTSRSFFFWYSFSTRLLLIFINSKPFGCKAIRRLTNCRVDLPTFNILQISRIVNESTFKYSATRTLRPIFSFSSVVKIENYFMYFVAVFCSQKGIPDFI